ncbi:MAG: cupin domain-containing protein [Acidobacteria bacterium]|nr:cupin domain-containing protein [Acidobacteriota bacterium]
MDIKAKAWGTTSLLFENPFFSLHLLRIEAGTFCSEHRHERKLNHFYVLSGKLVLHLWPAPGLEQDQPDRTVLIPGDSFTVPVGIWHQFAAREAVVCLEVYEAAPVEEDIERRSEGGIAR